MAAIAFCLLTLGVVPADAVQAALADVQSLPEADRPFVRWVFIPDASNETAAAMSVAVNQAASHAATIIHPVTPAGVFLQRWDLRALAPEEAQLVKLVQTWESMLEREKYFHARVPLKVAVAPYRASDGKTYDFKLVDGIGHAPHVGEAAIELSAETGTAIPIVRFDFFLRMLLSTVDGGLYYGFQQVERNPKGKTAQAAWLETFGASEAQVASLKSDERAAIFRSGVTGKPRRIDVFYGAGVRPSVGVPLITITHDVADGDIDATQSPIMNLLEFDDRAREAIAVRRNGTLAYALFNDAGALQDEVPPNIAADHQVPAPHTTRLIAGYSCLVCHSINGSDGRPEDGFRSFGNDVKRMEQSLLIAYADVSQREAATPAVFDKLQGLYNGDLRPAIMAGRTTYAQAVFVASGGRQVQEVTQRIQSIYAGYVYDVVTPQVACADLGVTVEADKAAAKFNELVPVLPFEVLGVRTEHPSAGALRAGIGINRFEWEEIFSDVMIRVQTAAAEKQVAVGEGGE